jgi:hypothetical protein
MKTLREIMDRLPAARRRKVDQRANALIAEERMRQDLPKARARRVTARKTSKDYGQEYPRTCQQTFQALK